MDPGTRGSTHSLRLRPPPRWGVRGVGAFVVSALVLAFGLALTPGSLEAQDRELIIEDFDSMIEVRPDGSFDVTETLRVNFIGSWNGLERELFFDHETAEGRRTRFQLELGEITDGSGTPLEVDRSGIRRGVSLRIWVPGANNAVRTVVIRYRVRDGLRFFEPQGDQEAWDELYYNVTGHGWRVPITAARARIRLPEGLEPTGAWGYTGSGGSTEQAVQVAQMDSDVRVTSLREFRAGEGLTVSVTWPAGVIPRPTVAGRARAGLLMYWPMGLPVAALFGMLGLWVRKGRDPYRGSVMVEYEPPDDLTPAEVGTLVDHKAEMHDITATLVDLAVRGYLRIEEVEKKGGIPFLSSRKEEWIFHQTRPKSSWKALAPHERAYITGLFADVLKAESGTFDLGEWFSYFGDSFREWRAARRDDRSFDAQGFWQDWMAERKEAEGEAEQVRGEDIMVQVKLSELENKFYTHIEKIRTKIYKELKRRGLYLRRPDHQVARWGGFGAVILFAAVFLGIMAAEPPFLHQHFPEPLPLGLGLALSGLAIMVVGQGMGVRTERGSRARAHILGFKEFLERVESDYYQRVVTSPELFEKYLPYAIALQVESRWAKAFEGIYREPPDWYQGSSGTGFRTTAFASSLNSLSTSASRTMSSSPGGSSGSGGGGSSGGGSGGGGGGGF